MSNICRFYLFIFILIGINIPLLSQSIHTGLKSLSDNADIILTGKVTQQKSEWNADRTRIFTKVTVTVEEYLKGSQNQSIIIIAHPGGEVDEVGEIYSHVPRFYDNENVLLFLQKDGDNRSYKVLEGESGKISLTVDKLTGEKITSDRKNVSAYKKQIKSFVEQQ
ncbi:MAG TPA: hypothetical protein VK870_05080 [Ignavibacteriaceae bacterium]|nr:hypothetical protein [Ignavibacteriaceae bacterium]